MAKYSASEQREFYEVEESVANAILYLGDRKFNLASVWKKFIRSPAQFDYELAKKKALVFLRCAYDEKRRGKAVFKNQNLRRVLKEALASDDLNFFKSAGRVLSKEQVSAKELDDIAFASATNLEKFLITYWIEDGNGMTPLCFLSMKDLSTACHAAGIHPNISEKTIHTVQTRLGLKRVKRFKFRGPGLRRVSDE
jgi:hypothetical protein